MPNPKFQAGKAKVVTPSNTVDITKNVSDINTGCVLYIGTGGDLKVKTIGGDEVTFVNIQDGSFLPVQVLRVFATGTSATNILALW
jgi:hypothetical protein